MMYKIVSTLVVGSELQAAIRSVNLLASSHMLGPSERCAGLPVEAIKLLFYLHHLNTSARFRNTPDKQTDLMIPKERQNDAFLPFKASVSWENNISL